MLGSFVYVEYISCSSRIHMICVMYSNSKCTTEVLKRLAASGINTNALNLLFKSSQGTILASEKAPLPLTAKKCYCWQPKNVIHQS